MKIARWFKGSMVHGGWGNAYEEPGAQIADCLGSAVGWTNIADLDLMDTVIDRLFPGRACDCGQPAIRIVHFNNHPDTTREDVDKVLQVYTEETEG